MADNIKVSIFKRSDRSPYYQMQYRDPITGDKISKSTGTNKRRDAERVAAKWEEEVKDGRDFRRGRMLWADFRQRYEDEVLPGLAESTGDKVDTAFNGIEEVIKPTRLSNITAESLGKYPQALRAKKRSESTIKSHLAHIRAALNWAVENGWLSAAPKVPRIHRAKVSKTMKGRPIATEEFERMLAKLGEVIIMPCHRSTKGEYNPDLERIPSWEHFLNGLWWSGLRLAESLQLHWTDETKLCIDLSCRHPMLRIPAELEKAHKDRLLPLAPEFAEFLLKTPKRSRTGYVFNPKPRKGWGTPYQRKPRRSVDFVLGDQGEREGRHKAVEHYAKVRQRARPTALVW